MSALILRENIAISLRWLSSTGMASKDVRQDAIRRVRIVQKILADQHAQPSSEDSRYLVEFVGDLRSLKNGDLDEDARLSLVTLGVLLLPPLCAGG